MSKLEQAELSKQFYELDALRLQHEKMETSYEEILSKVCSNLIHDLLVRLHQNPPNPPMYTVEVFTKDGTDSQACKQHILATTGTAPAIYDNGTHYVTHMRLTLEILKRLNDFEYVLEIMGDYTDTGPSLGPMHDIGDAHIARRPSHLFQPEQIQENTVAVRKKIGNTSRGIIYSSIGAVVIIALVGFIVSGGLLPNIDKGTSPFQVSDLGNVSGQVTGPFGLPGIGSSVIAHKIQQLPGTDQRLPDYTTNSIVSVDGKYFFSLPPGVYRLTVAFPDGTNQVISSYAVWPRTTLSIDFRAK